MRRVILILLVVCLSPMLPAKAVETITFSSKDGLKVTADLYQTHPDTAPFILLFHQAGWSRGEYLEIAPKLNKLGFNCLAVDQRSGNKVNNVPNETFRKAQQEMKPTQYLTAIPDMEAAISCFSTLLRATPCKTEGAGAAGTREA